MEMNCKQEIKQNAKGEKSQSVSDRKTTEMVMNAWKAWKFKKLI